MPITPDLFEAHLRCPTKCWLRVSRESPSGNEYADWVKTQTEAYRATETQRLVAQTPPADVAVSPPLDALKTAKWWLAIEVPACVPHETAGDRSADSLVRESQPSDETRGLGGPRPEVLLESNLHAIERIPSEGRGKAAQFIPIRFVWRNKLTKDDKLLLAFDAFVLGRALGREIALGKIVHGDPQTPRSRARERADPLEENPAEQPIAPGSSAFSRTRLQPQVLKVKTAALAGEVRKRLEKIATLFSGEPTSRSADGLVRESQPNDETRGLGGPRSGAAPPDLVLNRHCAECEFRDRCRQKAIEADDLSLLAGMSAKERQKLRSKGIFTVTQLSYTFRPRRRPRRLRDKREKYHHALKALAIREKKIHIVGRPELKIEGTAVYLDVEGLPDRDFYYSIATVSNWRTGNLCSTQIQPGVRI